MALSHSVTPPADSKEEAKVEAKVEAKTEEKEILPSHIRFATMNSAMFPIDKINGNALAPNAVRQTYIINYLLEAKPDFFATQEVWSRSAADRYQHELKSVYPYSVRGVGGDSWVHVRGGTLLFSKHRILKSETFTFKNYYPGDEWAGGKGCQIIWAEIPNTKYFITVFNVHLHAGPGCMPGSARQTEGTTSHVRGKQLAQVLEVLKARAAVPPATHPHLHHFKTVGLGDFNINTAVNLVRGETPEGTKLFVDDHSVLGISSGSAKNGFNLYNIKYRGQFDFALFFETQQLPVNYINPLKEKGRKRGKKTRDPQIVHWAKEHGFFTGTSRDKLPKEIYPQSSRKKLDMILISKEGAAEAKGKLFESRIVSLDQDDVAVSDHYMVIADLDLTKDQALIPSIFEGSIPKPIGGEDPSAGTLEEGHCCFTKPSTAPLYCLFPRVKKFARVKPGLSASEEDKVHAKFSTIV